MNYVHTVARGRLRWTQGYDQEDYKLMRCYMYVERYKIIATLMNSNRFTEFDMKR